MLHINFDSLIKTYPNCFNESKVASENGKRFEIDTKERITKIKIDNCLIDTNKSKKCDFGFVRHLKNDFYFVELKGKNITATYNQIVNSIINFENNLIQIPKNNRFGFIVSSKVPKAGTDTNTLKQRFKKNYGKNLEVKNKDCKI